MDAHSLKHKVISVAIVTVAAYFGFQALDLISGIYQIDTYFNVAWMVFAFHIFWLTFIFDLHFKSSGHISHARENFEGVRMLWHALRSRVRHLYHWHYLRHYLNYLILPPLIYWSVVILIYLNPFFELFKDGLIVATTRIVLGFVYWHMKEVFSHNMEVHRTSLKILFLGKLFAAYLMHTAATALGWYFGLSLAVLVPVVAFLTFMMIYQSLLQSKLLKLSVIPAALLMTAVTTTVWAIVHVNWNMNYYTAGLMTLVVYNTCWGLLHRYLEKSLTWKVVGEYLFILAVLASIILSTHDFKGRI